MVLLLVYVSAYICFELLPQGMAKKRTVYSGTLNAFPEMEVLLNVTHMQKGSYTLKILHKNKVIKVTSFTKV